MRVQNIRFEKIATDYCGISLDDFAIYREDTTDVLYIFTESGAISPMLDPENGLPLTFEKWKNKYQKF